MIFDYICHDCKCIWERDYRPGKAAKRTRCPDCDKLCKRYYGKLPAVHFKDPDFTINRHRFQRYQEKGMDSVQAHEYFNAAMKGCKERIATGGIVQYARYELNDLGYKKYKGRRLSEKEMRERDCVRKVVTEETYKRAGVTPGRKPVHSQGT